MRIFVPVTAAQTRYDMLAIDEDEDSYQFWVQLSTEKLEYTYAIELSDLQ